MTRQNQMSDLSALDRAHCSLAGLSVGDALGERFFGPPLETVTAMMARQLPTGLSRYTDDTQMALSIVDSLRVHGCIEPDYLAHAFAARYERGRGYGGGAHNLLRSIQLGGDYKTLTPAMFGGSGSYGNGAAMRIAPLGAYFADDLEAAIENAIRSARVTHTHPEGVAGAVAVSVAAALAYRDRAAEGFSPHAFLTAIAGLTPTGKTRDRLFEAAQIEPTTPSPRVAETLGSGQEVSAQDTVPFALWCAAAHFRDFVETFWATVSGLGDRDTTCAIACGVVALSGSAPPEQWLSLREPLPEGFE